MKCTNCQGFKFANGRTCTSCVGTGIEGVVSNPTPTFIATFLIMKGLLDYEPFLYSKSADNQSYYVHFRNLPCGHTHKLRVSNHPERARYGYKWQLRIDGLKKGEARKPNVKYFYNVDSLVKGFKAYYGKAVTEFDGMVRDLREVSIALSVYEDADRARTDDNFCGTSPMDTPLISQGVH